MAELTPGFKRLELSEYRGKRMRNIITMPSTTANPGEDIYVYIPKLSPRVVLIPDTMYLSFKFKVDNTKSYFMNSLGRLLVKQLQIQMSGVTVYDNAGESIMEIYKELWKPEYVRQNMYEYGIVPGNMRKKLSGNDTATNAHDAIVEIFSKMKIRLGKILCDSGPYAPYSTSLNPVYTIKLPKSSEILIAESGETVGNYQLTELCLEYESIESEKMYDQTTQDYVSIGRSLPFEHVLLLKSPTWGKDTTVINETINVPRKSVKAVVMLFKTKGDQTDSEHYEYPNIENVKVTVEGHPNGLYTNGLNPEMMYDEAKRLFGIGGKDPDNTYITQPKFYTSKKFALVTASSLVAVWEQLER